ncbi:MAG: hypothetical protein BWX87_02277 [Bacteroidetes bacterium ADurb.Bin123]|jgi:hypothetical protein|nr:MAG: hypothetical protein BWX87_02277 [Bacteroidetes bacterium ADurb.Bin123]
MVNANIPGKGGLFIGGDEPESFILLIQVMSLRAYVAVDVKVDPAGIKGGYAFLP